MMKKVEYDIKLVHSRLKPIIDSFHYEKRGNSYYKFENNFSKILSIERLPSLSNNITNYYSISIGYSCLEYHIILDSKLYGSKYFPKENQTLLTQEYSNVVKESEFSDSFYIIDKKNGVEEVNRLIIDVDSYWLPKLNSVSNSDQFINLLLGKHSFYIDKIIAGILLIKTGKLEHGNHIFKANFNQTNLFWQERITNAVNNVDLPIFKEIRSILVN